MKENGIKNAIPGGKYNCALLLKFHYPEIFSEFSIGKLISMIKKGI